MDLNEYQRQADDTDSVPLRRDSEEKLHFLMHGLVDEVGSLASLLKKCMRQDIAIGAQRPEFISRLGDALWYVAGVATYFKMPLSEVADSNLRFLKQRWTSVPTHMFSPEREPFSAAHERFPDRQTFVFKHETGADGVRRMTLLLEDGRQIGDTVDDNEYHEDFYRFHDVVHIGFMARFRWSPVFRKLLGLKRKSDRTTDRVEDGAKARDIEEAMSRLIFLYFEQNNFLDGATSVDTAFLKQLRLFSGQREIGWVTDKEWQDLMLESAAVIRQMIQASKNSQDGVLIADLNVRTLEFKPTA